jgi:hypothetical protein
VRFLFSDSLRLLELRSWPGVRESQLDSVLGMTGRVFERLLKGPLKGGMKMVAFALVIPVKTLLLVLYCIVL